MSSVRVYIGSVPGILNIWQVVLCFAVVLKLMADNYRPDEVYALRLDVLMVLMASFSLFVTSLLMLVGVLIGTLDLQYSPLYRLHYVLTASLYIPCTLVFAYKQTGAHTTREVLLTVGLAIANCSTFLGSAVIAYQPVFCPYRY